MIKIVIHKEVSTNLSNLLDYITSNCSEKPIFEEVIINKNTKGEMQKYIYRIEGKSRILNEYVIEKEENSFKLTHFVINNFQNIEKDDLD